MWEQRSALLSMVRSLRCQWDIAEEGLGWGGGLNSELFQGLGPCLGCLHPHFPGIQKSCCSLGQGTFSSVLSLGETGR